MTLPEFERLKTSPRTWLITGVAGFIGSNLLESLLGLDQTVVGLDNFATGSRRNLDEVRQRVSASQWARFRFVEGDIRDLETCRRTCDSVRPHVVLHQAALGSVPRSIRDPHSVHAVNVTGFLNMLVATRDANKSRFVYASSSSVYGDHPALPKVEDVTGRPMSPYGASKQTDELYAAVFSQCYGLQTVGLRYFNVFGRRQNPEGPYAAVIPRWVSALLRKQPVEIFGDGETSRDFCYVANVVRANILAGTVEDPNAIGKVYNIAVGARTSLNELFLLIRDKLAASRKMGACDAPVYREFRPGDMRHSHASIERATKWLGYRPSHTIVQGLDESLEWYVQNLSDETSLKEHRA
ncbi:MAG: SDR family oxidoreductase [Verrucomicrobia bacterium]|nr:SDR family oxidoreductase [Verrucomicrobiota bacterium]